MDAGVMPELGMIGAYLAEPARDRWQALNTFIQERYRSHPKITYSKCSAQPGWNVKYQKAGKSICTLYPEPRRFIVLVVVTLAMVPLIEAIAAQLEPELLAIVKSAKPFNGTLWLMLPVESDGMLESVKELLLLKYPA